MTYSDVPKPTTPNYSSIDAPSDFLLLTDSDFVLLTNGGRLILRKATQIYSSISKPATPTYTSINKPVISTSGIGSMAIGSTFIIS